MSRQSTSTAVLSFPDKGSRRGLIALGTGFLASLLLLAGLASSASAVDRVYWANGHSTGDSRISYAELDANGGGANLNTAAPGATAGQPRGVAIDTAEGRVFWSNRDASQISFANLTGLGPAANLSIPGATVDHPNGVAIHPAQGRIYWANEFSLNPVPDTLASADLDGDNGANLAINGAPVGTPNTPLVDPVGGRIYWANASGTDPGIYSADLDGGNGRPLVTEATAGAARVANPHGMAIDPQTRRLYWANPGTLNPDAPAHVISWIDLTNPAVRGNLTITATNPANPAPVNRPIGVAIDPDTRTIYWANWGSPYSIAVANLGDGVATGARTLSTAGATLNGPRSPALLKAPSGTALPEVTGASTEGSELTCSEGAWAQDLAASWLYRAPDPDRFTYSWTRNGGPITEADDATYKASVGGEYRCTVTARNAAGSTSQTSAAHTVVDTTAPGAVTAFAATAGDGRVALSWTNPLDADFEAVRVVRTIGAAASTPAQGVQVYEGNATRANAAGLTNGTEYTFTAFARDGDDNWSDARSVKATPRRAVSNPGGPSQPSTPGGGPPTGGSSQPPTVVAKPAFGPKTLLTMKVAARRIRGSGRIKVVIRNANGFEVSGRLSAQARKRASASRTWRFVVDAKSKKTVSLRLSKAQRRMLKREGKLSLRLTATVKDPAGGTRTVRKTVSLRLKTA